MFHFVLYWDSSGVFVILIPPNATRGEVYLCKRLCNFLLFRFSFFLVLGKCHMIINLHNCFNYRFVTTLSYFAGCMWSHQTQEFRPGVLKIWPWKVWGRIPRDFTEHESWDGLTQTSSVASEEEKSLLCSLSWSLVNCLLSFVIHYWSVMLFLRWPLLNLLPFLPFSFLSKLCLGGRRTEDFLCSQLEAFLCNIRVMSHQIDSSSPLIFKFH